MQPDSEVALPGPVFEVDRFAMRYSQFVPRLYNLCLKLGFEPGKIVPSRAFCSDETQGYPIILLAKHFGCFPFNHGQVGGVVALDRHGPFAQHGEDLLIIQASHVGFDPVSGAFGHYCRQQRQDRNTSQTCGAIAAALAAYLPVCKSLQACRPDSRSRITLPAILLNWNEQDVRVQLTPAGDACQVESAETGLTLRVPPGADLASSGDGSAAIAWLLKEGVAFQRRGLPRETAVGQIEHNLLPHMGRILTARHPMLAAAQFNSMAEFERCLQSVRTNPVFRGRNLLLACGLNVDVSPDAEQLFPLTKFIPWAAYRQNRDGQEQLLDQSEFNRQLRAVSGHNCAEVDLELAIERMEQLPEIHLKSGL